MTGELRFAPPDFGIDGWASTGRLRVRNHFSFLGRVGACVEELWHHRDGQQEWRTSGRAIEFVGEFA